MVSYSENATKKAVKYFERDQKEINEFVEAFRSSLELGSDHPRKHPVVYLLHGLSGVGKHTFLQRLEEKTLASYRQGLELYKDASGEPVFLHFSFGHVGVPQSPLRLMKLIFDELK
ncbi:MAG: hypothetical protein AAFY78_21245, partial [Cyanobacteria bacterium J06648_16]